MFSIMKKHKKQQAYYEIPMIINDIQAPTLRTLASKSRSFSRILLILIY